MVIEPQKRLKVTYPYFDHFYRMFLFDPFLDDKSAWNNFQAALSFQHLLAQISDWHMHGHLFQALTRRILKRAQARKLSTESFCVQGDALLLTRSTRTRTLVGKYSSSILGENPSKIPWGQMAHPRLNALPKTESAISTQMVSYSIASLAFVQPRTPVALLGIQNMI